MPPPSRRKPKRFSSAPARKRDLSLSNKWLNLIEFNDDRGKPYRRFYQLETLTNAVDKMILEGQRFIVPAIQQLLGRGKISSLTFTLQEEDALRFVFQMRVSDATRKRTNLRLVIAKNHEEATRRVVVEFKHLSALHPRIPDHMVEPVRAGTIFLPDRYRREGSHREVGAYLTTGPTGYEPLGIHRNQQYMSLGPTPHTFSKKETELLKQRMTTTILSSFDPITGNSIDGHQITPGAFQVFRPSRGLPKIMLFNCVHMQPRLTPSRLMGFLLTDEWESRGVQSPLTPEDPRQFYEAVVNAVGPENAKKWVDQFVSQAAADKVKAPKDGFVELLAEVAE